MYIIFPN